MINTIVCPGCGRSVTVDPDQTTKLTCPGCGKSLNRFLHEPDGSSPEDELNPLAAAVREQTSRRGPPLRLPTSSHPWMLVTLAALAGFCLLAGAVFVGYSLRGSSPAPTVSAADASWEQEHRSDFYKLKADAEALVLAGDLKAGHAKYSELQILAGSHPVHDPALFDLIQDARSSQERVYGLLLTKAETAMGYFNPAMENANPINPPGMTSTPAQPSTPPASQSTPSQPAYRAPTPQPSSAPITLIPTPTLPQPVAPAATAPTITPALPPAAAFAGREADRQIGTALDKGIGFLVSKFVNGQINDGQPADTIQHQGLDALCVYALLHASQGSGDPRLSIHGPFMVEAIGVLKSFPLQTDAGKAMAPVVYARSLRAAALAVYDRAEDRPMLRSDAAWLMKASSDGGYTYDDRFANPTANDPGLPINPNGQPVQPVQPGVLPPAGTRADPVPSAPVIVQASIAEEAADVHPRLRLESGALIETNSKTPKPVLRYFEEPDQSAGTPTLLADNGERPIFLPPRLLPTPPPVVPTQPPPKYDPLQTDTTPGPAYTQPGHVIPPWDNSNSQYGLFGVWSAAEAGVEVPTPYWKAVEKHWLGCELANGQWFYSNSARAGTLSMTCAGIASLLVTHEYLDAPALGTRVGRPPYSPALAQGLKWLETGDNAITLFTNDLFYFGYTAYGIERCGLASGFKFFGNHDWYTEIAGQILPHQDANGSWGRATDGPPALIDTAYTVLFLARGRHPVMMNKLRVEPFWDNRPRDLANLARFASRELERPLNWQVVSFERPWFDWMDAPVLYIASHQAMKLTDDDVSKLRSYAQAGGLIFTHADSGASEFNQFAEDLAKKLWPQYPMQDMPANHELFTVNYHLTNAPKLKMVTNGSRLLMVHSPTDLSPAWQEWMVRGKQRETFQLGVNLFVYAAGRGNFRNRLDSPYIPEPTGFPTATINIARIKYAGNWDPEPYAWTRFSRYFQWTTGQAVKVTEANFQDLKVATTPVAVMTGNREAPFTEADQLAAKAYVESGGTLLIDACGGSDAFAKSAEIFIAKTFPAISLTPIAPTNPVVAGNQPNLDNLTKPVPRNYTAEKLGKSDVPPMQFLTFGKGRVIYTPLDLTTGLLGTSNWAINGYTPAYCEAMVKNVLLTATH